MGSIFSVLFAVGEADTTADCEVAGRVAVVFCPTAQPQSVAHNIKQTTDDMFERRI